MDASREYIVSISAAFSHCSCLSTSKPHYVPGGITRHISHGDEEQITFTLDALREQGVSVDTHGNMPDVEIYDPARDWLLLIEAVRSHGSVDGKRHDELAQLFRGSRAGLIYVTAFPTRRAMVRYVSEISWEIEVWVAEAPDHMIHFNGVRFLGRYTRPDRQYGVVWQTDTLTLSPLPSNTLLQPTASV